jgi:hypothetical protein
MSNIENTTHSPRNSLTSTPLRNQHLPTPKDNKNNNNLKKEKNRLNKNSWLCILCCNCCCFKCFNQSKCFISLWSTLYCLFIVVLHAFFIRDSIIKCLSLRKKETILDLILFLNHSIKNNHVNLDYELITRLLSIILAIVFLILFVVFSLAKVGNYPNDGVKFGRDFFSEKKIHKKQHKPAKIAAPGSKNYDNLSSLNYSSSSMNETTKQQQQRSKFNCLKSIGNLIGLIYRHFLPLSSFFHLLSILVLLIPDLLFNNFNILNFHHHLNTSSNNLTTTTFCSTSNNNTLPDCLTHLNSLLNTTSHDLMFDKSLLNQQLINYRYEILSVALAFLTMSIRYGNVFWYSNKSLSFLITFIFFLCTLQQLLQLYSFWFLSKQIYLIDYLKLNHESLIINERNVLFSSSKGSSSVMNLFNFRSLLIDQHLKLLLLYVILFVFVLFTAMPAYAFAYLKYRERFMIEEHLFMKSLQVKNSEQQKVVSKMSCCFSYCPHLIATIQLILICILKLPFCYDFIIYYNHLKDYGIMICIIVEILHTIVLLFVWLLLTLKTEWQMHLKISYTICHWTYHLKMNEKLDNDNLPSILFQSSQGGHEIMTQNKNNVTASPPATIGKEGLKKQTSLDLFLDDSKPKILQQAKQQQQQQQIATITTSKPNQQHQNSDLMLLNSETLYRDEIRRKSLKNIVLLNNRNSCMPQFNSNQQQQQQQYLTNSQNIQDNFKSGSFYFKSYYNNNQQPMYKNARQLISDDGTITTNNTTSGIYLNSTSSSSSNNPIKTTAGPVLYLTNSRGGGGGGASGAEYESRV